MRSTLLLFLALPGCGPWTVKFPGDTGDPDHPPLPTWYRDADGDTWGATDRTWAGPRMPAGFVALPGDCDDHDATVHPDASETCDGLDEDCDGLVDDAPARAPSWYPDGDADGWGSDTDDPIVACEGPSGTARTDGDCDDADPTIHPGATERCGDGLDNDCDGSSGACGLPEGEVPLAEVGFRLAGDVAGAATGTAVAGAGDVDADGWPDLLVGGPGANGWTGEAWLVAGPVTAAASLATARARLSGRSDMEGAGSSVSAAGDLDRDGYDDFAVGGPGSASDPERAGVVFLVRGPLTGAVSLADADAVLENANPATDLGSRAAPLGDPGDAGGVVVGVSLSLTDFEYAALAVLDAVPAAPATVEDAATATILGTSAIAQGSFDAADFDGDGVSDLVVTGSGDTAAWLLPGPHAGTLSLEDASLTLDAAGSGTGRVVALGDTDGDGQSDLALGDPDREVGSTWDAGEVFLFRGPLSGTVALDAAVAVISGEESDARLGASLVLADLDGGGDADLAVAAPLARGGGYWSGAVAVFPDPVEGAILLSTAPILLPGPATGDQAGLSLAPAGDLNHDGAQDLLVGAPGDDTGGDGAGAAWLVLGGEGW